MEKKAICLLTNKEFPITALHQGYDLRKCIFDLILIDFPTFSNQHFICIDSFNNYRKKKLQQLINENKGEISTLEKDIIDSTTKQEY
jgi:hypothetical protein